MQGFRPRRWQQTTHLPPFRGEAGGPAAVRQLTTHLQTLASVRSSHHEAGQDREAQAGGEAGVTGRALAAVAGIVAIFALWRLVGGLQTGTMLWTSRSSFTYCA